jgi:peptidoglycan hydrolase-like protein with peptidoglycan-binding domain
MRRVLAPRRRLAAALALLIAVAVVLALVLGTGSSSPKAAASSDTYAGDTTVQRRDLVETDTESGTLSYAGSRTVYNRLSGTITWLPHVGQVIKPGQMLFKVGGQPVILLSGNTPAYRDLSSSDGAGEDILELNRNLVALGFDPDGIVIDDTWQAATTAGVKAFQASLGESQTGRLSLGKVAFLPGAQLVSTVQGTLGSSAASDPNPPTAPEFVSLEKSSAPKSHKPQSKNKLKRLEQLVSQLKAEIAHMKANSNSPSSPSQGSSPSSNNDSNNSNNSHNSNNSSNSHNSNDSSNSHNSNDSSHNNANDGGGGGTPVLQTSSTRLTVTVDLDASKQSEAKVGEQVTVEMPAGNVVNGRITSVSPVAQSSSSGNNGNSGSGSGSTIPVTIALASRQSGAGLDKASVSVNFAQAKAKNVLSVPVTALLATGGGRYSVQEAAAPHRLIPVTTGLFAAGYVQISGAGIYPGLNVTDSQG